MAQHWWQSAVIYQIYPRSFMDSDGDGNGDFGGIIQKLDYLKNLGVDAVMLGPIFDSPNDDNGYDVRDYYKIMSDYGSMGDFKELLGRAHSLGIRVIFDMVLNHTSDEHQWFIESKSGRDSKKRCYYIWRDGRNGGPPNNWGSFFSPSAWEYDEKSGQYYLHLFSKKQPDLNWKNEELKTQIFEMMNWWLDKGVDGFRLDAINGIDKPDGLPDSKLPPTYKEGYSLDPALYFNNPGLAGLLREMNSNVFTGHDIVTIGECSQTAPKQAAEYASLKGDTLSMLIHFEAVSLRDKWSVQSMRKVQQSWYDGTWGKAWSSQYLSNHDQPRQVSIYGSGSRHREMSAKLLATMIHTLPGTPFIYQGEELGMTNIKMKSVEDFNDISAHNDYYRLLGSGKSKRQALAWLNLYSRDHSRTPMQWDGSANAGFSLAAPWFRVNPNYKKINADKQTGDEDSVFNYYKALIALRKKNPVMVFGDYEDLSKDGSSVYTYTRSLGDEKWLVVLNLSNKRSSAEVNVDVSEESVLISNYRKNKINSGRMVCPPWYAAIFNIGSKE